MPYISKIKNKTAIALYVQPKASINKILGVHGDELKIAITAPPVDGKANKAVIIFMAKSLGVSKTGLRINKGAKSRHKQLVVEMDEKKIRDRLEKNLF